MYYVYICIQASIYIYIYVPENVYISICRFMCNLGGSVVRTYPHDNNNLLSKCYDVIRFH